MDKQTKLIAIVLLIVVGSGIIVYFINKSTNFIGNLFSNNNTGEGVKAISKIKVDWGKVKFKKAKINYIAQYIYQNLNGYTGEIKALSVYTMLHKLDSYKMLNVPTLRAIVKAFGIRDGNNLLEFLNKEYGNDKYLNYLRTLFAKAY